MLGFKGTVDKEAVRDHILCCTISNASSFFLTIPIPKHSGIFGASSFLGEQAPNTHDPDADVDELCRENMVL